MAIRLREGAIPDSRGLDSGGETWQIVQNAVKVNRDGRWDNVLIGGDANGDTFYLLDDAFRIGEYIQSGSYMGTVEGFTLRSMRLRHHNGPIFIVPFGSLGAVQNMSRDWAADKIVLSVTYDADIAKIKKLVKQVSQELMDNPDFAPSILEPLKMQGVDELGDFPVKIKLRLMTRPGDQAPIRRWALARIKTLFEENGVNFAYPTVQVADGQRGSAAAASAMQSLAAPKPAGA